MKVSELDGWTLDYWVGRAEGWTFGPPHKNHGWDVWRADSGSIVGVVPATAFHPSTDWSHGGPLVEKYDIELMISTNSSWRADSPSSEAYGTTPLLAICRAVVRAKFGDEVDSPQTYQQEK